MMAASLGYCTHRSRTRNGALLALFRVSSAPFEIIPRDGSHHAAHTAHATHVWHAATSATLFGLVGDEAFGSKQK